MYREKERRLCSHSITGLKRAFATMLMVAEIMTATPQFGYASTRGVGDMGGTAQIFTPQGQKKYELGKSAEMHENAFKILKTLHNENATDKEKKDAAEALEKMVDFGGSAKFRNFVGDLYTKGLISEETKKEILENFETKVVNKVITSSGKTAKLKGINEIINDKAAKDLVVFAYLVATVTLQDSFDYLRMQNKKELPSEISFIYKLNEDKYNKEIGNVQRVYKEEYSNNLREVPASVAETKSVFSQQSGLPNLSTGPIYINPILYALEGVKIEPQNVELTSRLLEKKLDAELEGMIIYDKNNAYLNPQFILSKDGSQKFIDFLKNQVKIENPEEVLNDIAKEVVKSGDPDKTINDLIKKGTITDDTKSIFLTYAYAVDAIKKAFEDAVFKANLKLISTGASLDIKTIEVGNNGELRFGVDLRYFKGKDLEDVIASGYVTLFLPWSRTSGFEVTVYASQNLSDGWPELSETTAGINTDFTLGLGKTSFNIGAGGQYGKGAQSLYLKVGPEYKITGKWSVDIKGNFELTHMDIEENIKGAGFGGTVADIIGGNIPSNIVKVGGEGTIRYRSGNFEFRFGLGAFQLRYGGEKEYVPEAEIYFKYNLKNIMNIGITGSITGNPWERK